MSVLQYRHSNEKNIERSATKFHDMEPHLEGEKQFGSNKWRLIEDIGDENESHRLDPMNFNVLKKSSSCLPHTREAKI